MYRIFACIHHKFEPNIGKYSIHGASGMAVGIGVSILCSKHIKQNGDERVNG